MNNASHVIARRAFARRSVCRRHKPSSEANLIVRKNENIFPQIPQIATIKKTAAARSHNPLLPDDNMLRSRRKDGLTEYEKNIEHDQSRRGSLRRARTQQPETLK